jgi:hypothetical protein
MVGGVISLGRAALIYRGGGPTEDDPRALALADAGDAPDHVVDLGVEGKDRAPAKDRREGLVQDAKHWNDVLVLVLHDELGERADDVERPLGVGDAHLAVEEARALERSREEPARVVPSVLRAGNGMEVEVDAKAILPCPFDRLEEVGPRNALEVRLSRLRLDRPEADRDPDIVEAGGGNLHAGGRRMAVQ